MPKVTKDERTLMIENLTRMLAFRVMFVLAGVLFALDSVVLKSSNPELALVFGAGGLAYLIGSIYYRRKY